ncbi:MAG TPA: N,N-dimethylformamidase beta subunit family domain-containing protein [Nocardioidaceae bacterium]|nr:N,N-dimethylformamidase beta subunit family domain-containing protein [Nocardioidaceae bacterium]
MGLRPALLGYSAVLLAAVSACSGLPARPLPGPAAVPGRSPAAAAAKPVVRSVRPGLPSARCPSPAAGLGVSAGCLQPLPVGGRIRVGQSAGQPAEPPHGAPGPASQRGLRGSNGWRTGDVARQGQVEGYPDPESVPPGRPIRLYLSARAKRVTVVVYRMGDYRGGWGHRVYLRKGVRTLPQPPAQLIASTRTVVAPWRPTLTVPTTGWVPGAYLAKVITPSGLHTSIPLVVRSTSVRGRVVLLAATQTWEAYNNWGGYSLYAGPLGYGDRSYEVSFDRPNPDAGGGDGRWAYDMPAMVQLAESLPIKLAYLADTDVQRYPHILAGATAVIVTAHAEYLSAVERARLAAARNRGTNIFWASANSDFWRVRLHPGVNGTGPDRLMVGYKDAALDPQAAADPRGATDEFRNPPDADPEQAITGARFECYPVDAAYVVSDPSWWGYRGTGARLGSTYPLVVGDEADRAVPGPWTPDPLEILSYSPFNCEGVPDHSTATYYTTPSGAGVIDTATERWTCDLSPICRDPVVPAVSRRFVRQVTTNVLLQFAKGPVGLRYPARNTIGDYPLDTGFPGTGGSEP